jgi:hypothetical protein
LSDTEYDVTTLDMIGCLVMEEMGKNQSHLGGVKTTFPSVSHWSDSMDVIGE